MLDVTQEYTLLTFKGICSNFLLELKNFILSHPVTSKQPHKIVQIHMRHPVIVHQSPRENKIKAILILKLTILK